LSLVQSEDLVRFGLIPEFVGRMPIHATLEELDKAALTRILKEPKNALLKQYKKLFEMEDVNLVFTDEALEAVASEAIRRKTGARGLRAIMESAMLDLMYEIPSAQNAQEIIINEDVILNGQSPIIMYEEPKSA
ncbi:MAG: ATP-dependent Clp protease ATP-binding subunit ClpX, partial [Deltaproteobacteria bacterium]